MAQLNVQVLQPDLTALQHALENIEDDDASTIMPFIHNFDKFPADQTQTARTVLRTTFWTQQSHGNHPYQFHNLFRLLTAQNLSTVVQTIGDPQIEKILFIECNEQYLSHYPIDDLIHLLSSHYSDSFANFVFLQFKGFLQRRLSSRIQYFKVISVKATIEILKNGGVGKSLTNDELIVVIIKMKKYLTSNRQNIDITDNTWLDCQSILPEIIQVLIGSDHSLKSLTVQNLQTIIDNDLIVNMDQAKNIIHELLQRQRKKHSSNINCDINNKISDTERLIGILSTDNFACFQRSMSSDAMNNNNNTRVLLDGPLVIMPHEPVASTSELINYSVLVQIQDLNPLFNTNSNNNRNQSQPKGSIFIVLLQAIPSNYEIALFVSDSFTNMSHRAEIKDLNIGMNNTNPVCLIPWQLPQIGKKVSFRLHARLRPTQKDVKKIEFGLKHMFSGISANTEQKNNDADITSSLWSIGGNTMVMCIYSGSRLSSNSNSNAPRLSWINVMVHNKMTFDDMIDSATAQLGLRSPSDNIANEASSTNIWSSNAVQPQTQQIYVVRNQMGHKCAMKALVIKYLDEMVMNSNLFPVFIFTEGSQRQQAQSQQQQASNAQNSAFANLNFNPAGNGNKKNPFQW